MTYSHEYGWLVLTFIMMAGVLIRQFFVLRHSGQAKWILPIIGIVLLLSMVWYLRPAPVDSTSSISDQQIQQVVNARCVSCHASKPTQAGFVAPPLGIGT